MTELEQIKFKQLPWTVKLTTFLVISEYIIASGIVGFIVIYSLIYG